MKLLEAAAAAHSALVICVRTVTTCARLTKQARAIGPQLNIEIRESVLSGVATYDEGAADRLARGRLITQKAFGVLKYGGNC